MTQVNQDKLHAFVGKMLGDLGGAFSVPTVRIGFRLGLFDAPNRDGSATPTELAARAGGLSERYVCEWALAQAAASIGAIARAVCSARSGIFPPDLCQLDCSGLAPSAGRHRGETQGRSQGRRCRLRRRFFNTSDGGSISE